MSITNQELSQHIVRVEVDLRREITDLRREMQQNHEVVVDFLARMDTYHSIAKWFFRTPIGVGIMWGIYKLGIAGLK